MSYRDTTEALNAQVDALRGELGEARGQLAAARAEIVELKTHGAATLKVPYTPAWRLLRVDGPLLGVVLFLAGMMAGCVLVALGGSR